MSADSAAELRRRAFLLLLERARPVTVEELSEVSELPADDVRQAVSEFASEGRVRLDDEQRVTGAAGLSVLPDRHEIELDGRRFWTWCAYDILGIFGATGATGRALSATPEGGETIELTFSDGRPAAIEAVLFRPDDDLMSSCDNVYEQWCPNSNLFRTQDLAERWSESHQIAGQVLSLDRASELATAEWRPLLDSQ